MAIEKVKPGAELESIAQEKGGGEKLKNLAAKVGAGTLEFVGDVAHLLKGANAAPLQETLNRGAAALRGEGAGARGGEELPAKESRAWVERGDWVRLFERDAVAREIGSKGPEIMTGKAWALVLGAPMGLAKKNLRDLDRVLSEVEGWRKPLANVEGRMTTYKDSLDKLRRLQEGVELAEACVATKEALKDLMDGISELGAGANRVAGGS